MGMGWSGETTCLSSWNCLQVSLKHQSIRLFFFCFVFCSKLEKSNFSVQKPYLLNAPTYLLVKYYKCFHCYLLTYRTSSNPRPQLSTRLLLFIWCCSSGSGMNTVWRWSIKPPAILQRTSFGSLPLTLRLVNVGVTTASSDWTFWPVKVTWTCRLTRWFSGAFTQINIVAHPYPPKSM